MKSILFISLVVLLVGCSPIVQGQSDRDDIIDALSIQNGTSSSSSNGTVLKSEQLSIDAPVRSSQVTAFFGDVVLDNDDSMMRSTGFESRIINGARADPNDYPFLVSLRVGDQHYCAGSVVHPQVIVTAAHCIEPVRQRGSDIPFVLGTKDVEDGSSNSMGTKASVVRGGYNAATHDNDVAVLLLNEALKNIETIPLAAPGTVVSKAAPLKIAGWGLQDESSTSLAPYLMEADVNFVEREECNKILGNGRISDNMICAGDLINGRDACQGDSGGPLIHMKQNEDGTQSPELLGVVSWGIGCGRVGLPGVYSSIPYFHEWIQSYINTWESEGRLASST
jgi:secreted trypsin-like serine protease